MKHDRGSKMGYADHFDAFVNRMYWTIYDPSATAAVQSPPSGSSLDSVHGRDLSIVATLGPSSKDPPIIKDLGALVDVFRINFSYLNSERTQRRREFKALVKDIRAKSPRSLILGDLQGPKVRIGQVGDPAAGVEEHVTLEKNKHLEIVVDTRGRLRGTAQQLPTSYSGFVADLGTDPAGKRVLLGDGDIELEIERIVDERRVAVRVVEGGVVSTGKGITVRGVTFTAPALREVDIENLLLCLESCVDLVALSFVKSADEVRAARLVVNEFKSALAPRLTEDRFERNELERGADSLKIVAKIELKQAVDDLDEILDWVDGVMVARGDLALNTPWHDLAHLETQILQAAQSKDKFTIVATEMLHTLSSRTMPARSEAFDVFYAVKNEASACMLSGETADGWRPVAAVETLDRLIRESRQLLPRTPPPPARVRLPMPVRDRDVAIVAALAITHELIDNPRTLHNLVRAGVDIFRLNLSIGCRNQQRKLIDEIDQLRKRERVQLFADFQGRRTTIGLIGELFEHEPRAFLKYGGTFVLTQTNQPGNATGAHCPHTNQIIDFWNRKGDDETLCLILGDREVVLEACDLRARSELTTRVVEEGWIYPGMGITVPGFVPEAEPLRGPEKKFLRELARKDKVDLIGVSFARCPEDLDVFRGLAPEIPLVAKIETRDGIDGIDAMLRSDDRLGVMVSRGDLYLDLGDPVELIAAQNRIIEKASAKGRFSIVSTGMLSNMVSKRVPLRSELIDIAYAVESGCSACLLVAGILAGTHPLEAVRTLSEVIRNAERP